MEYSSSWKILEILLRKFRVVLTNVPSSILDFDIHTYFILQLSKLLFRLKTCIKSSEAIACHRFFFLKLTIFFFFSASEVRSVSIDADFSLSIRQSSVNIGRLSHALNSNSIYSVVRSKSKSQDFFFEFNWVSMRAVVVVPMGPIDSRGNETLR